MKRILCVFSILSVLTVSAFAYGDDPPPDPLYFGCSWLTVDTQELGEVTIYFPLTYQTGYFSWDGSTLRNVSNTTITGYYMSDTDYYVRWSSFSEATYRYPSGNYWDTGDLHITDIVNTNVDLIEDMSSFVSGDKVLLASILAVLGVILLLLCMKKF